MAALSVCALSPVFAYSSVLAESQLPLRLSYCCLHVGQPQDLLNISPSRSFQALWNAHTKTSRRPGC